MAMHIRRREFITVLGGAAAWPLTARAQQPAMPVIGFLQAARPSRRHRAAPCRRGLAEAGYVETRTWRSNTAGRRARTTGCRTLAADLIARQVTVIATAGSTPAAIAAKAATATIPIVFAIGADPVALGLVASLNRPGGKAHRRDLSTPSWWPSGSGCCASWRRRPTASSRSSIPSLRTPVEVETRSRALRRLAWPTVLLRASTEAEIDEAFARLATVRQRFLVSPDPILPHPPRPTRRAGSALRPARCLSRSRQCRSGRSDELWANLADAYRQAGIYTGRILKGEKPADLPVVQPTKFELVINLKTAKALGLTVPPTLLAIADEVIE